MFRYATLPVGRRATVATLKVVCIVQARVGSSRLPGKIFERVGAQTILTQVLARAKTIPGVDAVHVTTTPQPADDAVVNLVRGAGVGWTRGQVPLAGREGRSDVLAGYWTAAVATEADVVMRITSDCPLLDPAVAGGVLRALQGEGCQYASNVQPPSFYDGCDVEVFSREALEAAHAAAGPDEREHVTTWMRRRPAAMGLVNVSTPDGSDWSALKLSVDTPEDLSRVRRTWDELRDRDQGRFGWREVIAAYHRAFAPPILERALGVYGHTARFDSRVRAFLLGSLGLSSGEAMRSPEAVAWMLGAEDVGLLGRPSEEERRRIAQLIAVMPEGVTT